MTRLPYPALLLSLAAHLALAAALGSASGGDGALATGAAAPRRDAPMLATLTRILVAAEIPPALAADLAVPAADAATVAEPATAAAESHSEYPTTAPAPTLLPAHYFAISELTERPQVLADIPSDQLRVLPDLAVRPAQAELLINELGGIDRVVLEDAQLSDQATRFVTEALEKIRFYPGRLGDMPVKSLLKIEVMLQHIALAP